MNDDDVFTKALNGAEMGRMVPRLCGVYTRYTFVLCIVYYGGAKGTCCTSIPSFLYFGMKEAMEEAGVSQFPKHHTRPLAFNFL